RVDIIFHSYLDMALIHLNGIETKCKCFPTFSKYDAEPGQSLWRLGFPFPELDCFKMNPDLNEIIFKQDGILNTPYFPLDGIKTRGVIDQTGTASMFEMSTPGLRGQSGGPIFDINGVVYG